LASTGRAWCAARPSRAVLSEVYDLPSSPPPSGAPIGCSLRPLPDRRLESVSLVGRPREHRRSIARRCWDRSVCLFCASYTKKNRVFAF
jgi:hypothetical protein